MLFAISSREKLLRKVERCIDLWRYNESLEAVLILCHLVNNRFFPRLSDLYSHMLSVPLTVPAMGSVLGSRSLVQTESGW